MADFTYRYRGQPHPYLTGRPGHAGRQAQAPAATRTVVQMPPINGAPLWAELHSRALLWSGAEDSEWLAKFRVRVPCGQCRKHWDEMLTKTPPDWANYFAWTVARHNEVNERLGKPGLSETEARSIWAPATPV